MIIANDATVKAGAFFPMTAKKVIRAQNIAIENHIPTIYLVDSGGVFLPLQEDVFPDTDDFGRVFRNNAVMSAMGIPQIAAIMGLCVAGGAYLPVMCDHILITEGSGLFLAGPALVQTAIGQKTSLEDLGGAKMHAQTSGTVDFREPDDDSCLRRIRALVDKMGHPPGAPFDHKPSKPPAYFAEDIYGIVAGDSSKQYDMREVIARIVDASEFEEYRAERGQTLLCGYARIGGWAVGIVANQKKSVNITIPGTGEKRIEFGGVIYTESADKAARFILDCNQNLVPLIFLHDVNGFMVGKEAEWSGIIRAGAKMVNAVANSVVPAASCRGRGAEPDSSAAGSGSAVVRSSSASSLEELGEESRRSHRGGMSTPAQMATMATYSIALLNDPPLGVADAGRPGGGFHGPWVQAHC